jgi:hypothetical protein
MEKEIKMKTFVKIALITLITAMVMLGCEPAITGPHNEYFGQYNEQFDSSLYTRSAYNGAFTVTARSINNSGAVVNGNLSTGDKAENTVTIAIGDQDADIFKSKPEDAESVLREFLYFYTYDPAELTAAEINAGKVHTLVPFTGAWSLDRRTAGNAFVLNLTYNFTAASSHLVWKIDSGRYTYSGGNKMDRNGNGVPAENIFDDVYGYLNVTGIINAQTPSLPGANKSISVNLNQYSAYDIAYSWDKTSDTTSKPFDITILAENDITASFMTQDETDALLKRLIGFIKVEKYANSDWSPVDVTAKFDDSAPANHSLVFKNFKADHMTAYRIVFEFEKGGKLETEKTYYGVNQRIIIGFNGESVSDSKTSKTRIEGDGYLYFNPGIRNIISLIGTYSDNSGIFNAVTTYTYTYTYTFSQWSPGWVLKQYNNPHYEIVFDAAFNFTDLGANIHYNSGDTDHDNYITLNDPRMNWDDVDFSTPSTNYVATASLNPTTKPNAPVTPNTSTTITTGNDDFTVPEPYPTPNLPNNPNTGGSNYNASGHWVWGTTQTAPYSTSATSTPVTTHTPIVVYRDRSRLELFSRDSYSQNIVLKLTLGPNSEHKDGVTTRYYAKELNLADFKENFKIYYSKTNSSLVSGGSIIRNDAIEIGIVNVEFKQEKNAQDTFVESNSVKYSGYNVIYITLDPDFRQVTNQYKALYIGDGFGYSDGITVFGGAKPWSVNKEFRAYNAGYDFSDITD